MRAKQPAGAQLFGVAAISRFLGLTALETRRRIESGEIPAEITRTGFVIAEKGVLAAIRATPHFRREGNAS
jgi:hypothetical protein